MICSVAFVFCSVCAWAANRPCVGRDDPGTVPSLTNPPTKSTAPLPKPPDPQSSKKKKEGGEGEGGAGAGAVYDSKVGVGVVGTNCVSLYRSHATRRKASCPCGANNTSHICPPKKKQQEANYSYDELLQRMQALLQDGDPSKAVSFGRVPIKMPPITLVGTREDS